VRNKYCLLYGLAMIAIAVAAGPLAAQTASAQTASGAGVYQQRCAQCH
jgi:mono/diheme cytochrome c family protein